MNKRRRYKAKGRRRVRRRALELLRLLRFDRRAAFRQMGRQMVIIEGVGYFRSDVPTSDGALSLRDIRQFEQCFNEAAPTSRS